MPSRAVRFKPAGENPQAVQKMKVFNSWLVWDGHRWLGQWDVFVALVALSPVWFFMAGFLKQPPIRFMGRGFYKLISLNRRILSHILKPFLP